MTKMSLKQTESDELRRRAQECVFRVSNFVLSGRTLINPDLLFISVCNFGLNYNFQIFKYVGFINRNA